MDFKLNRLMSYDNDSLLDEVRRVAELSEKDTFTVSEFKKHARVDICTLRDRFGDWKSILEAAKISHLYRDGTRKRSKSELLQELQRVASTQDLKSLTVKQFEQHSNLTIGPYFRAFGSWLNALKEAGLQPVSKGKRYSDEECFENLLSVWSHYGRQPKHKEMNLPPSEVGPRAYVTRWGSWTKALYAFVDQVENEEPSESSVEPQTNTSVQPKEYKGIQLDRRDIPLGMRYKILVRDKFRCVICGRSPATHLQISLHVDHIHPWSKGGATSIENLRVLCNECNLGKGAKVEEKI